MNQSIKTIDKSYSSSPNLPLVTVIIPVYNVSKYLSHCIESVIQQSYKNIEIVVINDGSSDDSGIICNQYAQSDNRIKVLHTKNRGLAAARNQGLRKANGMYILFVDSDDWIELNLIETLLNYAINLDADIVVGNGCKEYTKITVCSDLRDSLVKIQGLDLLSALVNGIIDNVMWNKLYRYKCFNGISFPDGHNYEDVSTTWRLIDSLANRNGKVVLTSERLYHVRVRESSISHTMSLKNVTDCWKAYYERFIGLPKFYDSLLPSCFSVISMMWKSYYRFSYEDKERSTITIDEMIRFSKKNVRKIIGERYPLKTKTICLFSQVKSPLLMWIYYIICLLHEMVMNTRYKMYE